jgi:hypothetical protein
MSTPPLIVILKRVPLAPVFGVNMINKIETGNQIQVYIIHERKTLSLRKYVIKENGNINTEIYDKKVKINEFNISIKNPQCPFK